MTDPQPVPLLHSVRITVSLRASRTPFVHDVPSAGYIELSVQNASAATVLKWLEIPLAMLRDQAVSDEGAPL